MMVVRKLGELYESCVEYRRHVRRVIYVFGLTLLEQTVPLIGNVLLIYAFKIEVSLIQLIATVPIIVLVTRMPISIDGIGVQEVMYVLLFGLVGVTASQALVISVAARLVNIACALPFAFFYLATWTNSRDLRKVPVRVTCTARKELEQSATVRLPD